jgi:hypothetical protein
MYEVDMPNYNEIPEPEVNVKAVAPVDELLTKRRFVLRVVIIVLTLSLWKGWFEENTFLDQKVAAENYALQSVTTPDYMPSFTRHVAERNEDEFQYRERQSGQPWKLIPMVIATALAGFLAIAPKGKAYMDAVIKFIMDIKGSMIVPLVASVLCGIFGTYMINGHASTGAFAGLIIGLYLHWLGKQRSESSKGGAAADNPKTMVAAS